MNITSKIQAKLTKILKKLKSLGIIQTFVLEMTFCQVEESLSKSLLEIDAVLRKCLRKIISKPRKAEIRNVIPELVRKKNLNDFLWGDEPSKDTSLITSLKNSNKFDTISVICEETFNSKKNLITHQKKHKRTDKYLCEKCGKLFYGMQQWLKHQSDLKGQSFVSENAETVSKNNNSELIQKNYDVKLLLNTERFNEMTEKAGKKFVCTCGKIFHVSKTLRKHERIKHSVSNILHKCITCGKCFIEKSKLNRHMLTHNDYQYKCTFCLQQFSRSDTLKRHISLFHFTSKKFTCSFCLKKFSLKYNRDIHEENVHKNVIKVVQCDYCGNKFRNKATLKNHFKTHFESKITCATCKKSFRTRGYYKIHLKNKHFGTTPCELDSVT